MGLQRRETEAGHIPARGKLPLMKIIYQEI
jgi:hypothetical protein